MVMAVQWIENIPSDGVAAHPNGKRGKRRTSALAGALILSVGTGKSRDLCSCVWGKKGVRGEGGGGAFASPPDKTNPSP